MLKTKTKKKKKLHTRAFTCYSMPQYNNWVELLAVSLFFCTFAGN